MIEDTRKSIAVSRTSFFSRWRSLDSWQSFMCLHLKFLDVDHPLTFEVSKLEQIEAMPSLPADVLWGSFVTHSFLPHCPVWDFMAVESRVT